MLLACGAAGAPAELWVNLGLATFHAGQYDLAVPCLERALARADGDGALGDVWYNLGTVAVAAGDFTLALQAFTVACAAEPGHAEARTNLGVLEARKGNAEAARAHYAAAQRAGEWLYEPWYNGALLAWRGGDVAGAFAQATRALAIFPGHTDSKDLVAQCRTALLSGHVDL
jgi:tetratricopeptide repeat protein 8